MEDELEDRVVYQTYMSHARLLSRASLGAWAGWGPWRLARVYLLRYEVAVLSLALLALLLYLQLHLKLPLPLPLPLRLPGSGNTPLALLNWEHRLGASAAFALQGRRPRMEDRFVLNEDVHGTGVSLFAIFDGHGGEFAADFAKEELIKSISDKILDLKNLLSGKKVESEISHQSLPKSLAKENPFLVERKKSFKKTISATDDSAKKEITDPELLNRLNMARPVTREVRPTASPSISITNVPLSNYIESGKIEYGKLISNEVLAADRQLVEKAKKTMDVAGTTALIAILENDRLTVANVGDSRGVMCDSKGNVIPLSFDHKPQQMREQKRIKEAGGYIAFNGVWRVAGILATSRAMGDYPLKDKKFVIADPDVLTFNLTDHKPLFIILATDGLWDTFSNEEAVSYIKERLDEPHYGAKSLTMQSYYRGSVDNITVMIVNLKDKQYVVSTAKAS